ncbi:MAG: hypothetical protein AAFZ58_01155 [Pseudomonadota bacterium]
MGVFGNIVRDVWNGRERLWATVWIWYAALTVFLQLLNRALVLQVDRVYAFPMLILILLHTIWILVGMWRCAYNTDFRWLGHAARAWVVINVIGIAWVLYERATGSANTLPLPIPVQEPPITT